MDLSKLDDEQIKVAIKVIASAKKHGINPDFVLPMVNAESGFRPDAHSGKAIGPMQLTPATAKDLKVDPHNVDENIDGGMRFLKGLMENKKLGGDPHNIFAAYNAGPNAKFFETGDLKDLPDETVSHVVKVMGSYGGEVPEMTVTPTEPEKAAPEASTAPEEQYSGEAVPTVPTQAQKERSAKEAEAIGAGLGVGVGAVKMPVIRMAHRLSQLLPSKKISIEDAGKMTEKVMASQAPVESVVKKPHGGENWQKALTGISTPGAQMDKASLDLAKGMQGAVGIGGAPGFTGGTITPGGIILSPQDAAAVQVRQQAAAAQAAENEARLQQSLQKAYGKDVVQRGARAVVNSAPVRTGLAGMGVGFNAQDAYNKFQQGDTLGGTLATGAAGASGLSLVPRLAPVMGPAAVGLTTAAQVAGDLKRGDRQGAAESGLSGLTALFPRIFGPLGAALYSGGLNKGEEERLREIRGLPPTVSP